MQAHHMLLVFEGPDGAGKSTLAASLAERLSASSQNCQLFSFPGKEPGSLGYHIYQLHHEPENYDVNKPNPTSLQLLHIAAHVDEIERRIKPSLEQGHWVVLDRYWWSTWVYGIVSGVSRRSLDSMIQVELDYWQEYVPAVVFLVDREHSLRDDMTDIYWQQLRAAYQELAERERQRYPVRVIRNDNSPEEAIEQVLTHLEEIWQHNSANTTSGSDEGPSANPHGSSAQLPTQLSMSLVQGEKAISSINKKRRTPYSYVALSPAEPSEVYDTYWQFAAERQSIFFRRLEGEVPPWTHDLILMRYKFTNSYRASDRVSQYLIRNVIYRGEQSAEELIFRILLFKLFNRIETWELLERELGTVSYADYSYDRYDTVLTKAMADGQAIFSAAYIMPSGKRAFGSAKKHRNCLKLLEVMLEGEVPVRLADTYSMKEAFELLSAYPMIGDFLAYQYITDINYSELINFSESEFVVPGPGARDGIRKCFHKLGGLNDVDIIKVVTERQEEEFSRLGINFRSLWGRQLQLIDCQNLFCEVDKYARLAHPEIKGIRKRKRIKQKYRSMDKSIDYWYPPKWRINHLVEGRTNDSDI